MNKPKQGPKPVDVYVGSRVRMRRLMLNTSQEKLAAALGLTFQQVQKYEKGKNRIGASRLVAIANALHISPTFFLDGAPSVQFGAGSDRSDAHNALAGQFFSLPHASELASDYVAIQNNRHRRVVADVARSIATGGGILSEAAE